jgi:peptidoglycan-associated lipoprotein
MLLPIPKLNLSLVVVGLALDVGGCAPKVSREDFAGEIARIREEMQTGDRRLEARVDSTNRLVAGHTRRLNALQQELQAFRGQYSVSIEKLNGLLKFNVPVHFEFDRSEVREADRPILDRFASVVREYYPGALVTVEGFTDPAGSAAYNEELGRRRAQAVMEYLASAGGLESSELRAVSYGESRARQVIPGASGPGEEGLENRRVALVIDHAAVAMDQIAMP